MSEYPQILAPQDDGSGVAPDPGEQAPPAPITEQEVGEYREQDRFLPVCYSVI
jgi:nuclear transcription Y subunit beta